MKLLTLLLLMSTTLAANCQNLLDISASSPSTENGLPKDKYTCLYYPGALVYSKPDFGSKTFTRLSGYCDSVKIIECITQKGMIKKNQIIDYWYKVNFPYNKGYYVGYIPALVLASNTLRYKETTILIKPVKLDKDNLVIGIRILKNGVQTQELIYKLTDIYIEPNSEKDTSAFFVYADLETRLRKINGPDSSNLLLEITCTTGPCTAYSITDLFLIKDHKVTTHLQTGYSSEYDGYIEKDDYFFPENPFVSAQKIIRVHTNEMPLENNVQMQIQNTDTITYIWQGKYVKSDSTHYSKTVKLPDTDQN